MAAASKAPATEVPVPAAPPPPAPVAPAVLAAASAATASPAAPPPASPKPAPPRMPPEVEIRDEPAPVPGTAEVVEAAQDDDSFESLFRSDGDLATPNTESGIDIMLE